MTHDTQFDWMRESIYEPAPIKRKRSPHAFVILAAIAVATGALIAASQVLG